MAGPGVPNPKHKPNIVSNAAMHSRSQVRVKSTGLTMSATCPVSPPSASQLTVAATAVRAITGRPRCKKGRTELAFRLDATRFHTPQAAIGCPKIRSRE
jgi:hypothetical protein